jgi:RNA polymerase sigma factor (sigma-70 family)
MGSAAIGHERVRRGRLVGMSSAGRRGVEGSDRNASARPPSPQAAIEAEELVRRCLVQAPGAWEEFLRRYGDLIYSTIQMKVGLSEADREDAFQNAVVAIYTHLDRLRDPERLVPWIIRIAYRHGVNRIRVRTRRRETPIDEIPDTQLRSMEGEGTEELPGEQAQLDLEYGQRAREAMEIIPARCRELLQVLFYQDPPLDYGDVARRLSIPIGSIGPTRARCLEKMRRIYERRGWGE